jgi:ABC-type sugar transport system substrate-binding protein
MLAIGMDQPIQDFPYFGADPVETGKMAGDALVDAAIEKWGNEPEIDLYIGLESTQGAQLNVDSMLNGYIPAIQARLDVPESKIVHCDVIDNDSQNAQRLVEDTINAHPDAKHILIGGYVDDAGQGAEAIVEKLNLQDNVIVTTIDGGSLAVNNFKNPDTSWVAAAALTPEMYGYYMLNFIEPYLRGDTDELSERLVYHTLLITKTNYKDSLEGLIKPVYSDYSLE